MSVCDEYFYILEHGESRRDFSQELWLSNISFSKATVASVPKLYHSAVL